ncbi:MAG: DsbA family protein, partial [Rickettsiales bacterium]|nr:DsbA family protein [Rickettsiales bacterium]
MPFFTRFVLCFMLMIPLAVHAEEGTGEVKVIPGDKDGTPVTVADPSPFETRYGSDDAKVTVVEYASLSCSHCAAFYTKEFPKIKEKYVDTGKVALIFRHFPLNLAALRASMLVACQPDDAEHQRFIGVLFKTQEDWAYTDAFVKKLETIASLGGVDKKKFESCIADREIEDALLLSRLNAGRHLEVSSTPSFFIDGEKYKGLPLADDLSKAIDARLNASAGEDTIGSSGDTSSAAETLQDAKDATESAVEAAIEAAPSAEEAKEVTEDAANEAAEAVEDAENAAEE